MRIFLFVIFSFTVMMLPWQRVYAQITDTSAQWIWVSGTTGSLIAASYGSIGTPAPSSGTGNRHPGARAENYTWTDAAGNLYTFGGFFNLANTFQDIWKYSPDDDTWTWINGASGYLKDATPGVQTVPAAANVPGCRANSISWVDSAGNFWVFGGLRNQNGIRRNDLWKYETSTNMWAWMNGNTANTTVAGNYGTKGVAASTNQPGSRGYGAPAGWTDHKNGKIYMFGGQGCGTTTTVGFLSDLWVYDMATNMWTWIGGPETIQTSNMARYGTKGVEHPDNYPLARQNPAYWQDTSGMFYMFGGATNVASVGYTLNDLWRYNPATNMWAWMAGDTTLADRFGEYGQRGLPDAANKPGSRQTALTWVDIHGKLWLYGGYGLGESGVFARLNDMWRYDPATNQWTWMFGDKNPGTANGLAGTYTALGAVGKPGARRQCDTWVDKDGNFWFYAGEGTNNTATASTRLDLWKLEAVVPPIPDQPGMFTTARPFVCMGESNVTYTVPVVSGATSYNWEYNGTNTTFTANTPTPTNSLSFAANATGGTLRVRAVNSAGNGPWRDTAITVNALPTVTSTNTGARSICQGDSLQLTASGSSGVSYQWKEGTTNVGTNSATYYAKTAGSYTVTATNASNCSATSTPATVLTVNTLPTVSSTNTGARSICSGDSLLLTASGSSGVSYQWKQGTTNVGTGATYYAKTAGSYTVTATNANNCSATSTPATVLTVNTLPTVSSTNTGARSICAGDSLLLTASGTSGVSYQWKQGTTNVGTGATYYAKTAGSYTVTATNANNCSATSTPATVLTVNTLPTVTSTNTGARSICAGDSLLLTASGTSGVSYQWKQGTTNVGTNSATYYAKTAGSYTVTVTNANNCSAISTPATTLTVNPLPVASVTVGGATEVCAGETVILTAATVSGADYQWKNGASSVGTNSNSYAAGATGAYKVVVTYTSTGCSDSTLPVEVYVYDRPVVSLEPGDTAFCDGGLVTLEVITQDTGLTYLWKNGSTTIPLASAYFLEITETGAYTVVVGRSAVPGCEDTTNEVVVTVHPLSVADVTWDGELLHATPGYASYQWNTGGQGIIGATDSTFEPSSDGGYSVTITDDNDCSTTSPVYNVTNVHVGDLIAVSVQVYPNPAKDVLYINAPTPVTATLSSMDGRLLQQQTNAHILHIGSYADGVYLLRITDSNGVLIRHDKVLKRN